MEIKTNMVVNLTTNMVVMYNEGGLFLMDKNDESFSRMINSLLMISDEELEDVKEDLIDLGVESYHQFILTEVNITL